MRNAPEALEDLLDQYFGIAYQQGKEGRSHDDIKGSAQETIDKIRACFADARRIRAALQSAADTPAPQAHVAGAFVAYLAETPLSGEPCPDDPSYTQDWTEHAGAHAIERLHDIITKARALNASARG